LGKRRLSENECGAQTGEDEHTAHDGSLTT